MAGASAAAAVTEGDDARASSKLKKRDAESQQVEIHGMPVSDIDPSQYQMPLSGPPFYMVNQQRTDI